MRSSLLISIGMTTVLAAMPLSELYAACTYTPTLGGERRYCSNGTCESESIWRDNQLVEVLYVRCGDVLQT
jgi:hypothetical protein